jgi:hypothetical protein
MPSVRRSLLHGPPGTGKTSQPLISEIVPPSDFRLRAVEMSAEGERAKSHRPELWDIAAIQKVSAADLRKIYERIKASSAMLAGKVPWLREVLFAGWMGGDLSETWRDLLKAIEGVVTNAAATKRIVAKHWAEILANALKDQKLDMGEISRFLGHANPSVTQNICFHWRDEALHARAAGSPSPAVSNRKVAKKCKILKMGLLPMSGVGLSL